MQEEAKANEEEDKKKREEIDKINEADTFVYHIEKTMSEMESKFDENEKAEITELAEKLKKAVEERNIEDIDKYNTELQGKWNTFITKVYNENNTTESMDEILKQATQGGNTGPIEAETVD
jgi:molecular chaperone DnaK